MRALGLVIGLVLASATAHAAWNVDGVTVMGENGIRMQGIRMQGIRMQGIRMQGIRMQGIRMQGIALDGIAMQNIRMQGTEFAGTIIDSQPSTCSHSQLVTGAALPASCNKCAAIVASKDSYCSQVAWDSACVSEAQSWCAFTAADLVGAELEADMADGTKLILRLDAVQTVPDPTPVWMFVAGKYRNISTNENADVKAYSFSIIAEDRCAACTNPFSCAMCTPTPITPTALCDSTDDDGVYNLAIPVAGQWNDCAGISGVNCGGKTPNTEATHFSLACRDVGVLAKCVERFGYKPWSDPFNPVAAPLHQSCVRMARADYCGDGQSHTLDGTKIDAYDRVVIQQSQSTWKHEALWSPFGAACVSDSRYTGADPGTSYASVAAYIEDKCPAKFGIGLGAGGHPMEIVGWSERARCNTATTPTVASPTETPPQAGWSAYIGNRASTLGHMLVDKYEPIMNP